MTTIGIHGFEFGIDTDDWRREEDAAKAEDLIVEMMEAWTPEYAAEMHRLSLMAQNGEIEYDCGILSEGLADCATLAGKILRTYASWPDVGHNAGFWAIA